MIEIALKEIEKYYGANKILHSITFEAQQGERIGVIGRNGTGKTTIFKLISGEEKADKGMLSIRRGSTIGYLAQIPEYGPGVLVSDLLLGAFEEALSIRSKMQELELQMSTCDREVLDRIMRSYGELQMAFEHKGGYSIEEKLSKVCTGLKLDEAYRSKNFNRLSGGEKTTVMLARILLQGPDILLLDEPTNHLDIESVEWLESYLAEYKGTVLIISHDRYFLDRTVTKIVEIEDGEATTYLGNYSYYVEEKDRRLLEQFEAFKDQQKKIKAMEEAIRRFRDWGTRADNPAMFKKAFNMEKRIEKMNKIDRPTLESKKIQLNFSGTNQSGKDVVLLKGLSKSFGSTLLFHELDLQIRYGEKVGMLGKNGCGKTTLLKILLGALEADAGEIKIGASVKIGYLEQNLSFSNEEHTVLDAFRESIPMAEGQARGILAKFLFYGEQVFKKVSSLSGGERARLRLCQLMHQDVNLLILDEPTNHLDIDSREMLEGALEDFDGTILFISHDRYFINKLAERIIELRNRQFDQYVGNYDYYKEKRMPEVKLVDKRIGEIKKPKQPVEKSPKSGEKKLELHIQRLEETIDALQKQIQALDQQMNQCPDDYEKANLLFTEKMDHQSKLDMLLEEWISLVD